MEAKCSNCDSTWEYEIKDLKIDPDGHELIVTLYCPICQHYVFAYNPNDLVYHVTPEYVDYQKAHPVKYEWE